MSEVPLYRPRLYQVLCCPRATRAPVLTQDAPPDGIRLVRFVLVRRIIIFVCYVVPRMPLDERIFIALMTSDRKLKASRESSK